MFRDNPLTSRCWMAAHNPIGDDLLLDLADTIQHLDLGAFLGQIWVNGGTTALAVNEGDKIFDVMVDVKVI